MEPNHSEVAARLAILGSVWEMYPHSQRPSREGLQKHVELTIDIPILEYKRCLDEAAARSEFMPMPKAVRDIYQNTRLDNPLLGIPTADEAWGEVKKALRQVGYTGTPEFSHPLIDRIVRNIGWRDICMSENESVMRSNFMRMWKELEGREAEVQSYMPKTRKQLENSGVKNLISATAKQLEAK